MNAFSWIMLGLFAWGAVSAPIGVLLGKAIKLGQSR
jgi:hypothetical protein